MKAKKPADPRRGPFDYLDLVEPVVIRKWSQGPRVGHILSPADWAR